MSIITKTTTHAEYSYTMGFEEDRVYAFHTTTSEVRLEGYFRLTLGSRQRGQKIIRIYTITYNNRSILPHKDNITSDLPKQHISIRIKGHKTTSIALQLIIRTTLLPTSMNLLHHLIFYANSHSPHLSKIK